MTPSSNDTATLARLRDKLATLAATGATPSGMVPFGAEMHRFKLTPPLTEAAVGKLEAELGHTLPSGYRAFLLELGASGAGPFYGLLAPADWNAGLHYAREQGYDAITLTDQGCANYSVLVLSGPHRGHVVYFTDLGDAYFTEPGDFLAWYERWLDELLWDYEAPWFGVGLAGREPEFLGALTSADPERQAMGAEAMLGLPSVSPESRAALVAALRTNIPAVQTAAIPSLGKHDEAALESLAPILFATQDATLLLALLHTFERTPHANPHVGHPDAQVACFALQRCTLDEAALAPLLDGPHWQDVAMALRDRRGDGTHATPRLISMMSDSDEKKRQAGIVCLRIWREASAKDALVARLAVEPVPELRQQLIEAIGMLGDREALLDAVRGDDPHVRFRAIYVLGQLGERRALPLLEGLLNDPTKPRGSAWSMGEQAKRAIAAIEAAKPQDPFYRARTPERKGCRGRVSGAGSRN